MTSSSLLWSLAVVTFCVIGDVTMAWYVNDDSAAAANDYGGESVGGGGGGGGGNAPGALLADDVINSDDVKRLIGGGGDEMADGGDMTCKRKMISVFGQLLISEYNRKHESGGFVISSDIWNQCKDDMCVIYFNISPTQCIPTSTDPAYCDVIIVSEGQRSCHASVDMSEGVVRAPLACQLTFPQAPDDGAAELSGSQRQFAKLLASVVKRPTKRWGQMHGHVHPF